MINKLRLLLFSLIAAVSLFGAVPAMAVDCSSGNLSTKDALRCGAAGPNQGQVQNPSDSADKFNAILTDILNVITVLAGIVAVIMVITAGFRFITSGGNPDRVKSARSALLYAIIGIVVVAMAQIIVQFVLDKSVNAGLTPSTSGLYRIAIIQGLFHAF